VWNQWFLDEATKKPLVVVPAIPAQPHSALHQQIESQWNPVDLNRSQQSAHRCERFTSTERHKDGVTFRGVQVWLGGFSDRPGQVGLVHNVFHDHDPLPLRFLASKLQADPLWQRRDFHHFPRASHPQAVIRLVLDEYGADVGDGADARTHLHRVAYLEIHLPTSTAF
jgi:hypothetical protein